MLINYIVFSYRVIICLNILSVDTEYIMSVSWRSGFFYQLYSLLYLIGNCNEESGMALKQIMEILTIMHSQGNSYLYLLLSIDYTLEFKNALTLERLFLNKYPELKIDYQEIAIGILSTGLFFSFLFLSSD